MPERNKYTFIAVHIMLQRARKDERRLITECLPGGVRIAHYSTAPGAAYNLLRAANAIRRLASAQSVSEIAAGVHTHAAAAFPYFAIFAHKF
jgi:hypothetical protein